MIHRGGLSLSIIIWRRRGEGKFPFALRPENSLGGPLLSPLLLVGLTKYPYIRQLYPPLSKYMYINHFMISDFYINLFVVFKVAKACKRRKTKN
jgi:hypothetical protein